MSPQVQPLSYQHRNIYFYLLATIFCLSLPFLFLYATGYRFSFWQTAWVSTGGLYVAADRTGAEIYIDDELVRETRAFRRAFYAQGLDAGTHKVHVQKEGHHTWVKELPVYPHLVTEALAFNFPLSPQVRVITPWQTTAGVPVLTSSSTLLSKTTAINQYLFEPRASTSTLVVNQEYQNLLKEFLSATTTNATKATEAAPQLEQTLFELEDVISSIGEVPTTTKEWHGVRLFESEGEIYAAYIGPRDQMPYYYCAEAFPPYEAATTSVKTVAAAVAAVDIARAAIDPEEELLLKTKSISPDAVCNPQIKIDRGGQLVKEFDFFPGSSDLVLLTQENGVYAVEVDNRAWQNRQPIISGEKLSVLVRNGVIYVYDGKIIYQISVNQAWF